MVASIPTMTGRIRDRESRLLYFIQGGDDELGGGQVRQARGRILPWPHTPARSCFGGVSV